MREIIFDTETTGLSPEQGDRVIEIGAIEMVNRFPTGKTFHHYLHPGDQPIHPDAEAIHGISMEQLEGKPSFADVLDEFIAFFGEGQLIAHNAKFDMGFINAELKRVKQPAIDNDRVVDTLVIARRKFPGARNSLDALCDRFGISNAHRTLHGALLDSELLADVYIELTGGRQAGFALDHEREDDNRGTEESDGGPQTMRQRPAPLPDRLSAEALEAHAGFVAKMGEDAIWNKWRPPASGEKPAE